MKVVHTVLGIDPGSRLTGFSILRQAAQKIDLLECGCIQLDKEELMSDRLKILYDILTRHVVNHQVSIISLETPFLGKNAQTFLKLGYIRGVVQLIAAQNNVAMVEFAPREIKLATTGFGGAEKEQVANVLYRFFPGLQAIVKKHDTTDAVAIALTGLLRKPNFSISNIKR